MGQYIANPKVNFNKKIDEKMQSALDDLEILCKDILHSIILDDPEPFNLFETYKLHSQRVVDIIENNFCLIADIKIFFHWLGVFDLYFINNVKYTNKYTFMDFLEYYKNDDGGMNVVMKIEEDLRTLIFCEKNV